MPKTQPSNAPKTFVRIKPRTRPKLEAIARLRRWTLAETADAIADEYVKRHRVELGVGVTVGGVQAPAADGAEGTISTVR